MRAEETGVVAMETVTSGRGTFWSWNLHGGVRTILKFLA